MKDNEASGIVRFTDLKEPDDEQLEVALAALKAALNEKFSHYLEKLQEKGIQIIENNVTITINDEQAQMSGSVYVIESECGREEISIEYN